MGTRLTTAGLTLALLVQATACLAQESSVTNKRASTASRLHRDGRVVRAAGYSRAGTSDRLASLLNEGDGQSDAPSIAQEFNGSEAPAAPEAEGDYTFASDGFADEGCDSCGGGGCGLCIGSSSWCGLGWSWGCGFGSCGNYCGDGCDDGYDEGTCGGCFGGCLGCNPLCSIMSQLQLTDRILCPEAGCNGWFLEGWVDQGLTGNIDSPESNFNTPLAFNDRSNEWLVNQIYLAFGREVGQNCCWDVGGRIDMFYGSDYFFTEAIGMELRSDGSPRWNGSEGPRSRVRRGTISDAPVYGVSLPQMYAEFYAPVGNGLRAKVGRFYSPLGYESVMAPNNFFYSRSYSMVYGRPLTHTGVLLSYDINSCWSFDGGYTEGWDIWDNPDNEAGFVGKVTWTSPRKRTVISAAVHSGDEQANQRSSYNVFLRHRINQCLTIALEHDWGTEQDAGVNQGDANWYSVLGYGYYSLTPTLDVGLRVEWFRDRDNARIFAVPSTQVVGTDYQAITFGCNYHPCEEVIFRPELRWDVSDVKPFGQGGIFNDFTKGDQFTLGFDLITRF